MASTFQGGRVSIRYAPRVHYFNAVKSFNYKIYLPWPVVADG